MAGLPVSQCDPVRLLQAGKMEANWIPEVERRRDRKIPRGKESRELRERDLNT